MRGVLFPGGIWRWLRGIACEAAAAAALGTWRTRVKPHRTPQRSLRLPGSHPVCMRSRLWNAEGHVPHGVPFPPGLFRVLSPGWTQIQLTSSRGL